jgi:D-tyrosyl-tRNA(Tyr) deacylase
MRIVLQRVSSASVDVVADDRKTIDGSKSLDNAPTADHSALAKHTDTNVSTKTAVCTSVKRREHTDSEPCDDPDCPENEASDIAANSDIPFSRQDTSFKPQHIDAGYVLLVGVSDADGEEQIAWLSHKISNLRIFEDDHGKMNRSIHEIHGSILSISQFTLYADTRKGNRPSFITAGKPDHANAIWHRFNEALRAEGIPVCEGRFGAHMRIRLCNDGPVTICFDTDQLMH